MDRKEFLKQSSIAGLGISMFPYNLVRPNFEQARNPRIKKKIIVAGAGIAGLCCAYELMKMGHEVIVLERALWRNSSVSI